jgi:hypothetical protein
MSEPEALQKRRQFLFEKIGQAADEIGRIDSRLNSLLEGRRGQGGAGAA